jgi:hypothetical protein
MKFLKSYKVFENQDEDQLEKEQNEKKEYFDLMGKLLHLYGGIPVPKEKSSVVIKKIITADMGRTFKLGEDVDINFCKPHDKIRFSDYFDSLLEDKDVRGHNFEGLIAGLYDGTLSLRGSKYDLTIEGKKYSVKFVDHKNKAPEIGRFKSIIESNTRLNKKVLESGGLTSVFRSDDTRLKTKVWNAITSEIDGWILAYPDNISNPTNIVINIVDKPEMFRIVNQGYVVAPKGGLADKYSLALSSTYKSVGEYETSNIKIPFVSLDDLRNEYSTVKSEDWSTQVFGNIAFKMRPDVLRYIRMNKDNIIKKLSEMD